MQKVIIIGAGPAGITAAYELLKNNKNEYDVTILEESNEIGGISRTVKYNGNRMDIGGHRFFSKDEKIMNLWKEIMPLQGENSFDDEKLQIKKTLEIGGPSPEKEDEVMLIRNRVSRIYYLKKFFDYPISMKIETFKNMGLIRTIKAGFSYLKSVFIKRKENSLEDFYINRFGKVLYSMFFEKYTQKLWGRHPKEISADWGAQRVKGLSITAVIKDMFSKTFKKKNNQNAEVSLIEQFWYPKYGPGQLWEILANKTQNLGAKILKGYNVTNINIQEGKIKSVTCKVNEDQETIEADIFISSMPLKDLILGMNIAHDHVCVQNTNEQMSNDVGVGVPDEPQNNMRNGDKQTSNINLNNNEIQQIKQIAGGLPYRDFITVGVYLNQLKLKNKTKIKTLGNIIPDNWIYIQEPDVKIGRIQIFNNWSPYLVKEAQNKVWIGLEYFCNESDEYWNMDEKQFTDFAISELEKINIIDKKDVLDTHVEKVKKAYPAYFDTYSQIDKIIEYLNKFENLYCIGRNGQHRYNNMDHSMLTAIEAANNIKNNIKDKANIWNVNAQKEYHERK